MAQLHGDEGPAFCDEVRRRTGAEVIKAARVAASADVQDLGRFHHVDYHLLDTHRDHAPGGTGETFDWSLAASRRSSVPLILSGGLNAGNVARGDRRRLAVRGRRRERHRGLAGHQGPGEARARSRRRCGATEEDELAEPDAVPATEPAA